MDHAVLDKAQQQIVDASREPGNEEAKDVRGRTEWVRKVGEADDGHKQEVVEQIVRSQLEEEHVVQVQTNDEDRGQIRAGREWQAFAVLHGNCIAGVSKSVVDIRQSKDGDDSVRSRVKEVPPSNVGSGEWIAQTEI